MRSLSFQMSKKEMVNLQYADSTTTPPSFSTSAIAAIACHQLRIQMEYAVPLIRDLQPESWALKHSQRCLGLLA